MAKEVALAAAKPKRVPEKTTKPKSKPTKQPSALHPPYFQMISEAISSLKERTGSSQHAIAKSIEDKYKTGLPPNFKKLLSIQLKHFAKTEKLMKVKNSFKISSSEKVKRGGVEIKEKTKKKKNEEKSSTKQVIKVSTVKKTEKESTKVAKMKRLSQVKTPECLKKVEKPKKKDLKPKSTAKV